MYRTYRLLPLFVLSAVIGSCLLGPHVSFASTGTIDPLISYAWSNNDGWVNWYAATTTPYAVQVTDTTLTGYIWDARTGWINLSPTGSGVTNDGHGTLGGYAWGTGVGWISFSGVTIDTNGRFHGTAIGERVGTLTFDCSTCGVVTDWRAPAVAGVTSGGGGSASVPAVTTPTVTSTTTASTTIKVPQILPPIPVQAHPTSRPPNPVTQPIHPLSGTQQPTSALDTSLDHCLVVQNAQMTLTPTQCGELQQTFPGIGTVLVDVNSHATTSVIVYQTTVDTTHVDPATSAQSGNIFTVTALDPKSRSSVSQFSNYIKITLPMNGISGTVGIFEKDRSSGQWIQLNNVMVGTSSVTFFADHVSSYVIRHVTAAPIPGEVTHVANTPTSSNPVVATPCILFSPSFDVTLGWYIRLFGCTRWPLFAALVFCGILVTLVSVFRLRRRA